MMKNTGKIIRIVLALAIIAVFSLPAQALALSASPPTPTGAQWNDIISVAEYEQTLGITSGTKYGTTGAWCAAFISWCAKTAGIPSSIIPYSKFSSADFDYIGTRHLASDTSYTPRTGDIVVYADDAHHYHVGLVIQWMGTYAKTIEGNLSGTVKYSQTNYYRNEAGKAVPPYLYVTPNYTAQKVASVNASPQSYNSVAVSWAAEVHADWYEVYCDNGSACALITANTSPYIVTGLPTGRTCSFKVRTVTNWTNWSNSSGSWKSTTTQVYGGWSDMVTTNTVPSVPASISASSTDIGKIKVSWGAAMGATAYAVYRSKAADSGFERLASTDSQSYTDASATPGQTYYYKVRAYKDIDGSNVYGPYTPVANTRTQVGSTTAALTLVYPKSIVVSWSKVSGATAYQIYCATSSGGTYSLVATVTSLSYTNSGLKSGTTYYYKVRAYHLDGGTQVNGSFSSVVSKKVP